MDYDPPPKRTGGFLKTKETMKPKDAVLIESYIVYPGEKIPVSTLRRPKREYYIPIAAISCYYLVEDGEGVVELNNGRKFEGVKFSDLCSIESYFNVNKHQS